MRGSGSNYLKISSLISSIRLTTNYRVLHNSKAAHAHKVRIFSKSRNERFLKEKNYGNNNFYERQKNTNKN